jgi:hypothetical protein
MRQKISSLRLIDIAKVNWHCILSMMYKCFAGKQGGSAEYHAFLVGGIPILSEKNSLHCLKGALNSSEFARMHNCESCVTQSLIAASDMSRLQACILGNGEQSLGYEAAL